MAGTFTNPAISAWPAELMRGCSFSDNFKTMTRIEDNAGTDTGAGNTADRGLVTTGGGYISYDVVSQPGDFSVTVRFKMSKLFVDGDMELDGVDSYSVGNGASLEKTTDSPQAGSQALRITRLLEWGGAKQSILVSGMEYWAQVYMRSDGIVTGRALENNNGLFQTTTAKTWQSYSDEFTASGPLFRLVKNGTEGVYVDADSVIVRPIGILLGNANLISGAAADGFTIWLDGDGVKANHSDGATVPTQCAVDIAYDDGEEHTITYMVDKNSTHSLYVDALDVDTQATTINVETGASTAILAAGDGTNNFAGTLLSARVFDALLTEGEHDAYHAGTFPSFFRSPLAAYPCNEFNDRSSIQQIWDRTVNKNDMVKGDGLTASTYPTFTTDALDQEYYSFDGATDYLSSLPTLPATFTTTAARRANAAALPTIQQDNDTTLTDDLAVAGDFAGFLHSMVIHSGVLTALELLHDEYQHLHNLWHGRSFGTFARAGVEGSQQLSVFLDYSSDPYDDHSPNQLTHAVDLNTTQNGRLGTSFTAVNSAVTYDNTAALQMANGTIFVYLLDDGSLTSGTLVDKGANYKLTIAAVSDGPVEYQLNFNGSAAALSGVTDRIETVAVVFKSGFKPRFFIDGAFFAEGTTTETPDDTDTTGLVIGNANEFDDVTPYDLKQVHLFDRPFADHEIIALHQQARYINNIPV